jgi:NAD(P)H dehydrogenase (quinone)
MFGVVGATGRTGRVVAEALLAHGSEVRAIVRRDEAARAWRARGAEAVIAPLEESLDRAFAGLEAVYVLLPEDPRRPEFHAPRGRMTVAIGDAVERCGVAHVVLLSTFAAALAEGNGPARDLHALEARLERTGCRLTTLRAAFFQENVGMALAPARHDGIFPTIAAAPSQRIPTVATSDVGRAAARCLLEPPDANETVGLAGPAYSFEEMAGLLGTALGRTIQVVAIPREAQVGALVGSGLSDELARAIVEMQACVESGRVPFHADRWPECPTRLEQTLDTLVR